MTEIQEVPIKWQTKYTIYPFQLLDGRQGEIRIREKNGAEIYIEGVMLARERNFERAIVRLKSELEAASHVRPCRNQ